MYTLIRSRQVVVKVAAQRAADGPRRLGPALGVAFALAAALSGCAPAVLRAQQSSACLPTSDTLATDLRRIIRHIADPNGSSSVKESRDSLRIPATTASQVIFVSDKTVCRRAADAYRANSTADASFAPSGRVYVVKAGQTYSVVDPAYHYRRQPDVTIMTFDTKWRLLSKH